MKNLKRTVIIVVASVIITLIISTKSLATTGKITEETVNLRQEASTSSKILKQLDGGAEVEILEEDGDWYKVKYDSITGYVSKKLVDTDASGSTETQAEQTTVAEENTETQAEQTTIAEENAETQEEQTAATTKNIEINSEYTITSEIEVRIIPLMNAIKATKLNANTSIKVIDSMNNWYYVEAGNDCGWVRKQVLEVVINLEAEEQTQNSVSNIEEVENETETVSEETQNTETATSEQEQYTEFETSKTGYISATTVNFREEASTSSTVIKKLTKNTEVEILGQVSDEWYKITVDGKTGFVSLQYVSDTKVEDTSSRSMSSTQIAQIQENADQTATSEEDEKVKETESQQETIDTTTTTGDEIVAYAKTFLGTKYVSGGSSPSTGFDCSGFTKYVYAHFGITLYRTSTDQIKNGTAVSKSDLQPGDLLIFNGSSNTSIGHVGIYIGDNQFIHASNPSDGVKITSLSDSYYVARYVGARRLY
jgi:cell wall-associated NlpC family hydrolase